MEYHKDSWLSRSHKRKLEEVEPNVRCFSIDELNQDLLERVLSWLPASSLFRLTSVCKRWKSVTQSLSFQLACSKIPFREPWFYMVGSNSNQLTVFDSSERSWKKLNPPPSLQPNVSQDSIPVAASGALMCFFNEPSDFTVCNHVTGASRKLPKVLPPQRSQALHALAMTTLPSQQGYKIVLIYKDLARWSCRIFNSVTNIWEEETAFTRNRESKSWVFEESEIDCPMYFLSKTGNVVATDVHRSPSKQYSSVITKSNGDEIVYFLTSSGTIVSCNLTRKWFLEYPRLLPFFSEYSVDLVECGGEMLVVVLSEFFESASLRVWKFDDCAGSWHQVCAMPPTYSHEFYGRKVDINCVGAGNQILVCLSSGHFFSYVTCNLETHKWEELPSVTADGCAVEFISAFAFEPRIEASV